MDPTFGHPIWIFSGVALVLIGFWLLGWATSRDTATRAVPTFTIGFLTLKIIS